MQNAKFRIADETFSAWRVKSGVVGSRAPIIAPSVKICDFASSPEGGFAVGKDGRGFATSDEF